MNPNADPAPYLPFVLIDKQRLAKALKAQLACTYDRKDPHESGLVVGLKIALALVECAD
jgi:hypothetical protein